MRITLPLILAWPSLKICLRSLAIPVFIMFGVSQCQSQFRPPQVDITDKDTVNYGFFQQEQNALENGAYLEPFFKKMYRQRTEGGQKISIVHLGDSHVLGNMVTQEMRLRLQREFGDAGRGIIFPYKLAGTNGPKDYLVESNARWYATNCQHDLKEATPYGISGFILESFNESGELKLRLKDTATLESRMFTKVTIFHRKDDKQFTLNVRDEVTAQDAILFMQDDYFKSYYFDRPVAQATISFKRQKNAPKGSLMLDGILLENELSGVVYHSIGVNGGKFSDFVRARFFARELADLDPDLIILSFGTNEAQGKVNDRYLYQQMETLVDQIRQHAPKAYFLFTTPADSYLKGRGYNPYMSTVSEIIRKFARDKHYACWDLFGLSGGDRSAQNWKTSGLMSSDSVHYSKSGYSVQGKLLYQSVIRAYNEFVEQYRAE
ncbi:MAG: hypothetical protein IT260_00330 [Saprospiraceae bacterium]|nr:hypothetical protein [Saprospiraceae bacterium]